MKKTITCATTSLLLIGILTLQTLAINFKSEENIDNLVFPFIYSDADDLVWVRKYVGDCSTCISPDKKGCQKQSGALLGYGEGAVP